MKMRFEVETKIQDWNHPLRKNEPTKEIFEVEEGENFDRIVGNTNDEPIFNIKKYLGNRVLLGYSRLFTLKTFNNGNQMVDLFMDQPVALTYLWGENGITKKITYKGAITEDPSEETEIVK